MLTKFFWIFSAAEFLFFIALLLPAFSGQWRSGPEGPVGGWLLLLPPIFVAITWVIVFFSHSDVVVKGFFLFHLVFVVAIVGEKISDTLKKYKDAHTRLGDDDFPAPQRDLAHAILDRDLARLEQLLPAAGDLNKQYGHRTFLEFAAYNTGMGDPSVIKTLLKAGANPNFPADGSVLRSALIGNQPEVLKVLLEAGANPNVLDGAGRPLWWGPLNERYAFDPAVLRAFLDRGANLTLRDQDSGPVGYAAEAYNWPAVWMLMERGAPWKGDARYGRTLADMVALGFQGATNPSEDLKNVRAKLEAEK
jgi:hypothetical protein